MFNYGDTYNLFDNQETHNLTLQIAIRINVWHCEFYVLLMYKLKDCLSYDIMK